MLTDKQERKIWIWMAVAAVALILGIVGLGVASNWDNGDGNVQCVAIGSNPCVPVNTK